MSNFQTKNLPILNLFSQRKKKSNLIVAKSAKISSLRYQMFNKNENLWTNDILYSIISKIMKYWHVIPICQITIFGIMFLYKS